MKKAKEEADDRAREFSDSESVEMHGFKVEPERRFDLPSTSMKI